MAVARGVAARRVHTLAMAVVDDAASLFRAADGAATLALLAKLTVEAAQQCKMEEARNKLQVCAPAAEQNAIVHGPPHLCTAPSRHRDKPSFC